MPAETGLLTPEEFRRHFPKIGRGSLYALLRSGRIRHLRIGRKILIPASEIIAFPRRETDSA